ncbi:MAG: hypothetical protein HY511_01220 [Actinobacteria bacterium]|nr:hypothetical protein [Actinomycetota bacterium]
MTSIDRLAAVPWSPAGGIRRTPARPSALSPMEGQRRLAMMQATKEE